MKNRNIIVLGLAFASLGTYVQYANESIEELAETINKFKVKKIFEKEPSKFMSKPRNNFKK